MLLAAILAGIFVMHTAGHAEDGTAAAPPAVPVLHTDGHVEVEQRARGAHALYAGHAAHAAHVADAGHAGTPGREAIGASEPGAGHAHHHPFGCDLTSMCLGLLAGAAVLLVLAGARLTGPPRGPSPALRGRDGAGTAPPRPPSLAVLSVCRT